MGTVSWRHVYLISIIIRFFIGLSDSYIHPDEHFQVFEVLTAKFFNYQTAIPWEFSGDKPARSLGPLYLFYSPLLGFIKGFGINISPSGVWYLARLELILFSWIVTDMCLYRILPTKPERIKAMFFTLTSYITFVYQSHCFSNSLETPLLLVCIMIIGDLRFDQEVRKCRNPDYERLFYLGLVGSIGIFNRITFPAFLVLPSFFVFRYLWTFKLGIIVMVLGALIPAVSFIMIDTYEFKGQINLRAEDLVITPLNNLLYNTKYDNLAVHGIHPYYTHILINLPQVMGPLLLVLFYKFKNSYYKTVPFLSLVSGLVFLSVIPHQELRFLTPLLPVACCCLDFNNIEGTEIEKEEIKNKIASNERNIVPEKVVTLTSRFASYILYSWYAFNAVMAVLMGIFHQGGVIPALDYSFQNLMPSDPFVQIWWRTYSPPLWLLGDTNHSTKMITMDKFKVDLENRHRNIVIDAMGNDQQDVYDIISLARKWNKKVMIVAPVASMNCDFHFDGFKLVWKHWQHLDLDHLNFESMECLTPGLGIYELV